MDNLSEKRVDLTEGTQLWIDDDAHMYVLKRKESTLSSTLF